MRLAVGLLVALGLMAGFVGEALAQAGSARRVALVVGNAAYVESPLRNPINDARAMAESLKQRGFTVILRENTSKLDLERAVADFGEQLQQGATGLFYFAGHGMQVNGRNFLIPVDAQIPSEQRVRLEAVDVDVVLEQMQAARSAVNLVILDACRNNPFEKRFRSAGGGGLAQINAPEGTLIAYATAPGSVAADGNSKHSLYTEELLAAMQTPGAKVEEVFKKVRVAVSQRSNGAQTPWEASSLTGDFFFVPPARPAPVVAAPPPPPAAPVETGPNRAAMELAFWDAVKGSNNQQELEAYLTQFPNGTFAPLARARIAALTAPASRAVPATNPPAAAPPASPPASAAPPAVSQMAAVPPAVARQPATVPLAPASFDGTYTAQVRLSSSGDETATITISNLKINGYVGSACALAGSLDPSGTIRSLSAQCTGSGRPSTTVLFVGAFKPDGAGRVHGDTTVRAPGIGTHGAQVRWTREGQGPVLALRPSGPLARADSLDGTYMARVMLWPSEVVDATIVVQDGRISGEASEHCPITGQLSAAGQVESMVMQCNRDFGGSSTGGVKRYTAQMTGSFGLDAASGRVFGKTSYYGPVFGSEAVWVRQ